MKLACLILIWILVMLLQKIELCAAVRIGWIWSLYCFFTRLFWDVWPERPCFRLAVFYSHRRFQTKDIYRASSRICSISQGPHYGTISSVLIFWKSMLLFHHSETLWDYWVRSKVFSFIQRGRNKNACFFYFAKLWW